MKFGDRLKLARELRGLGIRELGRLTNVPTSTLSKIESGAQTLVTTEVADRLAKVLRVSRLWLCWGDGHPTEPSETYRDLHREQIKEDQGVSDS